MLSDAYTQIYPDRRIPSKILFQRLVQRIRDTGRCDKGHREGANVRTARTVRRERQILSIIRRYPDITTRSIASAVNISHSSVWQVLKEANLHPYRIQRVQQLNPGDFVRRRIFCEWFLNKCREQARFPKYVLFTDEAIFTKEGICNSHNNHMWKEINPHAIREGGFQNRFSVKGGS